MLPDLAIGQDCSRMSLLFMISILLFKFVVYIKDLIIYVKKSKIELCNNYRI